MEIKKAIKKILPNSLIMMGKRALSAYNNQCMLKKKANINSFDKNRYPYGINLIGDIKAETGLGQSMRIIARMLELCQIPFTVLQVDSPGGLEHDNLDWNDKIGNQALYGINLLHINPGIWAETYIKLEKEWLDDRYNIAFWLWELEEFPKEWLPCIETVDEIWTPSDFISKSIAKRTDRLVWTVPYHIEINMDRTYGRNYFQLPDNKFLFLVMYDFKSISERKNPKGAIRAFKKEFTGNENDVGLIIKVNHLKHGSELKTLKRELSGYNNIYLIENNLSRKEVESLIREADVLVSLHRSEGYGLPLAEAMYMGTPVIATGWSANTEFMDEKSACLVRYKLIKLKKNIGPYKKGNRWADADEQQAAEYMRRLFSDRPFYLQLKKKGEEKIRDCKGIDAIKTRIGEIFGGYNESD